MFGGNSMLKTYANLKSVTTSYDGNDTGKYWNLR